MQEVSTPVESPRRITPLPTEGVQTTAIRRRTIESSLEALIPKGEPSFMQLWLASQEREAVRERARDEARKEERREFMTFLALLFKKD